MKKKVRDERMEKVEKAKVRWNKKIHAWVAKDGRVVAPRLDEDGWDYFFVPNKDSKSAEARYCSGERYWAFGMEIAMRRYADLLYLIGEKPPKSEK